jgi:hypothetical protein
MIKIADVFESGNGMKKVKFFHLGLYDLLREKLGFRYTKINKRGYYLKNIDGIYKVVDFHELKDSIVNFIKKDFDTINFNIPINYIDFLNEFYRQMPIKNGNFSRVYLGENFILSDENKHLILLEIDVKYLHNFSKSEMIKFLNNQGFIETSDKIGSFVKDCPLYYKKISSGKYLIFHMPFYKINASQSYFDFFCISARSEKEFLLRRYDNPEVIKYGFNLKSDFNLFENTIRK